MAEAQQWQWRGNELVDANGVLIASELGGVISMTDALPSAAHERFLVEKTSLEQGSVTFSVQAMSGTGQLFTAEQKYLTVGTLVADCRGRVYTLKRINPFRRERRILNPRGVEVARTRHTREGIMMTATAEDAELLPRDAVFISYCCLLVDGPHRAIRT
ncbi:hypothetical protein [Corynebacterium sp.]|uniref:hypothetical protein n=1 Tax=Corynebacterium sp. TaxID=1720 RepID=UPI0026DDAE39|nr:hypothetical protein [Corynebacterium sp.]MDO5031031.1 hypothetical protein [Corynebacterium sp.]